MLASDDIHLDWCLSTDSLWSTRYFKATHNVGRVKSSVDDLTMERGTVSMRVALVLRSAEVQPLLRDLCDTPTEGVVVVIANSPPQCLSVGKSDGGPKAGGVWLVTSSCRCCTKDKSTAYGRSWRMLLAAATLLAGSESPESQCRGRRGMMDLFQRVSGYLRVLFDMSRINQVAN